MNNLIFIFLFMFFSMAHADIQDPDLGKDGVVSQNTDSFYDPTLDYATFSGRVSDKDRVAKILKIQTENANVKFFKVGDGVQFWTDSKRVKRCEGFIRDLEPGHFVVFANDISECSPDSEYFRRGTLLNFFSPILTERVKEGSAYRRSIIQQRADFYAQLKELNHALWSQDQRKIQVAAEYDAMILEIEQQKQRALDGLILKRQEEARLQKELMDKLTLIDDDLDRYRVERQELFIDRWHLDQDIGLPMQKRPELVPLSKEANSDRKKRWANPDFK